MLKLKDCMCENLRIENFKKKINIKLLIKTADFGI